MFKYLLPSLLTAIAASMPTIATAQSPPAAPLGLTLAAAQEKVMQNSPALSALAYEIRALDGQVEQAGLLPNPELSGLIEDRQSATRTTTIQLTQPIETGGKRGARINAARSERDLATAALRAKRAEMHADTSKAFHALLAAQARLTIAQEMQDLAKQALRSASAKVEAGKNSPVDETRSRIAASGAEIELMQARADVDNARETLAALWGGNAQELGAITGELDRMPALAPLPTLLDRLAAAPGLARARAQLDRRIAFGRVESARRMPDLGLTLGTKKDEQLGRRQAVFGVSVPLPLFDRNQGRMTEALNRTEQARVELAAEKTALSSELRIAHARLTAAIGQARALQEVHLPGARSAHEATRKGYEYGKFSILEVLDAQRVHLQAQSQHLRVLAEAHSAAADIERILGATGAISPQDLP